MSNLVLGLAQEYGINEINHFVKSFREVNKTDDICLCVSTGKLAELEDFLVENNVIILEIVDFSFPVPHNTKFISYQHFLLENTQYDKICLSDTRDVIFQSDPFTNCLEDAFCYAWYEDIGVPIFKNKVNRDWLIELYPTFYKDYLSKPVVCSGVIIGSYQKIISLLDKIVKELLHVYHENYNFSQKNIIDQAVFNHLVYKVLRKTDIQVSEGNNICFHLSSSISNINGISNTEFINGKVYVNGVMPSIIHQYDRHGFLRDFYNMYFVYKNLSLEKDIDPQTFSWN